MSESSLKDRLSGKNVFIVGGTKGIGANLGISLAKRGSNVVISGRADSNNVLAELKKEGPQGNHGFIQGDCGLVKGASDVAKEYMKTHDRLDILVLALGIFSQKQRVETADGLEEDFAVSYFSRWVILHEMKEYLENQAQRGEPARVYIYGFPGNGEPIKNRDDIQWKRSYNQMNAHMNTVTLNEALVTSFAKVAPKVAVFGVSPGLIQTDIRRNMVGHGFFGNSVETLIGLLGRDMTAHVEALVQPIASPELGVNVTGAHFNTYGEPIQGCPRLDANEIAFYADYSQKIFDDIEKKSN
jgi:NAD(P)-dependent dehydrogenase (short-subunit alcohol dehydrogenase family)